DPSAGRAIDQDSRVYLRGHEGTALIITRATTASRHEGNASGMDKPRKIKLTFNVATSVDSANALLGKSPIEKHGAGFGRDNDVKIFG
ncbi:MAG: hypothetical protein GY827_05260, partial [Cytophagales bacterium]|nr:hypothetical protein [Cytophagales bacterium]